MTMMMGANCSVGRLNKPGGKSARGKLTKHQKSQIFLNHLLEFF